MANFWLWMIYICITFSRLFSSNVIDFDWSIDAWTFCHVKLERVVYANIVMQSELGFNIQWCFRIHGSLCSYTHTPLQWGKWLSSPVSFDSFLLSLAFQQIAAWLIFYFLLWIIYICISFSRFFSSNVIDFDWSIDAWTFCLVKLERVVYANIVMQSELGINIQWYFRIHGSLCSFIHTALQCGKWLSSNADNMPFKFQNDWEKCQHWLMRYWNALIIPSDAWLFLSWGNMTHLSHEVLKMIHWNFP